MNKDYLKKTEKLLYKYYESIKNVDKLKNKIDILCTQRENIENDITHTNITLPEQSMNTYMEERVQTSFNSTSYAEKETIRAIEKLEKELVYKKQKIFKLRSRIREIEENIEDIKYNIELLEEDDKRFLKYKYSQKKSMEQIAITFNMSRATAYRKKDSLLNTLATSIGIIK